MAALGDLFQSLEQTDSKEKLWQEIFHGFSALGCETTVFLYGSLEHRFARSNMQRAFAEHYQSENLARVDPFVHHSLKNPRPMFTGINFWDYYPTGTKQQLQFAHEVGDVGFKSGISIPLSSVPAHGFGGWNIGGDLSRKDAELVITENLKDIQLFSHYAFHCLLQQQQQDFKSLSSREYDVLNYAALGWGNQTIADKLGIAVGTVEFHFRSIRSKLKANNRAHAIAIAIKYRLIDPLL